MTEWPVVIQGIVEAVVTTKGPNDRWNVAALGLHEGDPVTARTWGETRTRQNFEREAAGIIHFTEDPVLFVEAALSIVERDDPVLSEAAAWVSVDVEHCAAGTTGGTDWAEWSLTPRQAEIRRRGVPTINRGSNAVVEATVAASRLDVEAYSTPELLDRLAYYWDVVERCGSERDRDAFRRLDELIGYELPRESVS